MSWGSDGGGFGPSKSAELWRNVNLSTSANTFVILCGGAGAGVTGTTGSDGPATAFSFSFPRPVTELYAFMNVLGSFAADAEDGGAIGPKPPAPTPALLLGPACMNRPSPTGSCAVAGWKVVRGL